ncbi:MAG TPA: hypothetical protein ENO23_00860 [Alphaproteobacteria bacterium]|nr:hypothetical protein [Alphaproteobacteria bacterium]
MIDETGGAIQGWLTIRRPWGTYLPSELDILARKLMLESLTKEPATDREGRQASVDAIGSHSTAALMRRAGQVGGGPSEVGV